MRGGSASKLPGRSSRTSTHSNLKKPSNQSNLKKPSTATVDEQQIQQHPEPKEKEFSLPALSIGPRVVATLDDKELAKLRRKTIRRHAPPGEDLKCIKTILRTIKGEKVTVQEFISLIAPSTGDQGAALRSVMNEDLAAFRQLARKVYETITQDNSDVLLNQQLQLAEFHKEKKDFFNSKMMAAIEEIFRMVPNFDFDRYHKEKQRYLEEVLPIPDEMKMEPEEIEMMKRQMAYHRLQWLRSEGERLNEENNRLKERLNQLKMEHIAEQHRMADKEREAAHAREKLEAAEANKQEELDELSQSLEKTIIEKEAILRQKADADVFTPLSRAATGKKVKKKPRPNWQQISAVEIDLKSIEDYKQGEASKIKGSPKERSPFHYSPINDNNFECPLSCGQPSGNVSTYSAEQVEEDDYPSQGAPCRRRGTAPKDTWGGFY